MKIRNSTVTALSLSVLISVFFSCTNPTGMNLTSLPTPIESDSGSGLIAGVSLDSETLLNLDNVSTGGSIEWVAGLSGNAVRGDADGDFIRITDGSLTELTDAGTISVWIYSEDDNAWAGILHKGDEKETEFSKGIWHYVDEAWSLQYTEANSPYFFLNGENGVAALDFAGSISQNEWHNITVSWDYDAVSDLLNAIMYIDGVNVVEISETGIGAIIDTDGDMIIGSQLPLSYNSTWGHMTFRGIIDEVAMFDRALTPAEVQAAFDTLNPNP